MRLVLQENPRELYLAFVLESFLGQSLLSLDCLRASRISQTLKTVQPFALSRLPHVYCQDPTVGNTYVATQRRF